MTVDTMHGFEGELQELDFALGGLHVETVGCLAATGCSGKSMWAMQAGMGVCSEAADDALLRLNARRRGRVVIWNAEDPEIIILHRLRAMGQRFPHPVRVEVAERLQIESVVGMMPDIMDQKWRDTVVKQSEGARLVIFDTFSRWHRLKENDNGDMAYVVSVFEWVAKQTGAAVLYLHHTSKGMARDGRQDEQQATRGAAAITDNARWQGWMQSMTVEQAHLFGKSAEQRAKFVRWGGNKENYGEETAGRWLERTEGGVLKPVDLIATKSDDKLLRREKRDEEY